jgi:hypothetical protein
MLFSRRWASVRLDLKIQYLFEIWIMAKKIKEEVIDLGDGIELTMVLIPK